MIAVWLAGLAPTSGLATPPEGAPLASRDQGQRAPRPLDTDLHGLLDQGVALSARLSPAELDIALADRLQRRNPAQDPAPNAALLCFRVGVRRLGDGDVETGLGLMRHAFEHGIVPRFPPNSRPRLSATRAMADACRVHGCPNLAEPLYEGLLQHTRTAQGPESPQTLALIRDLGDTQRRQKAYDVAERTLQSGLRAGAAAATPGLAPLHDVLALIFQETEQPGRALAALQAALDARSPLPPEHPARAAAAMALARFLLDRGRPTAAEVALAAVASSPASTAAEVALLMGEALFAEGRFDRAEAHLDAGYRRLPASLPATDPARLPWHYALASARAAAGRRPEAVRFIAEAREVARAHPEAATPFTARFLDLTHRIEQLDAVAAQAAVLPPSPFPTPPPPKGKPGSNASWVAARALAHKGDLAGALRLGAHAVQRSGAGRFELARWAARAERVEAALGWLTTAARLEGVDPRVVATDPDFAALRTDPRQRGLMADLETVALHWRQQPHAARSEARGTDPDPDGLRWVLLVPDPEDPAAWLDPQRDGPRVAPDVALAVTGPVGLGPRRAGFSGQPGLDDGHVRRLLDRASWPAAPGRAVVVGRGATAAVALAVALHDPDQYVGAVVLTPLPVEVLAAAASAPQTLAPSSRILLTCAGGPTLAAARAALEPAGAQVACLPEAPAASAPDFVAWRTALNALR